MFNEIIMPTSHIQRSPAEIVDRPNVAEFQIRQGFRAFFFLNLKCTLSHFGRGSGGALRKLVIRNRPAPVSKLTGVLRSPVDIGAGAFRVSIGNYTTPGRRSGGRPPTSAAPHINRTSKICTRHISEVI